MRELSRIKIIENNNRLKKEGRKLPIPTKRQIEEWDLISEKRRVESFFKLPKKQQKMLEDFLLENPNVLEIKIGGSWLNGKWADENSSNEILNYRKLINYGKTKLSDLDIAVKPRMNGFIYFNSGLNVSPEFSYFEKKKHITGVVIFKNGKFI